MLSPPFTDVAEIATLEFNFVPSPLKLFSLIPKLNVWPDVPYPAPALISPVGCSITVISIFFLYSLFVSTIL